MKKISKSKPMLYIAYGSNINIQQMSLLYEIYGWFGEGKG